MLNCFITLEKKLKKLNITPIYAVKKSDFSRWLKSQSPAVKQWLYVTQFSAEAGKVALLQNAKGNLDGVVCILGDKNNFWDAGHLALTLPEGYYQFATDDQENLSIAWGLGAYQFSDYKQPSRSPAVLVLPKKADAILNIVESIYLVRDLINRPTEDLGPSELAHAAMQLAKRYQAKFKQVVGGELLKKNYPAIHAVGRASDDAPRLIDVRWGKARHPKIVLVGKGVCFDSGGLDIKNSSGMLLMKKDMGGAAHVLGLARMIMQAKLPVNLRVLIPAVENSISGNAYRPGDVIKSRKGLTIEIGNTDAEGRVVLADALTEAVSDNPDLIIDMATLTGAARIALGTELPAIFSHHDTLVQEVIAQGEKMLDPMWRLPLHAPYRDSLYSSIADINNAGADSYAGAITAALFLNEFVPESIPWLHFDLMAWNLKSRSGRPQGGEAMALRALFAYLMDRFS